MKIFWLCIAIATSLASQAFGQSVVAPNASATATGNVVFSPLAPTPLRIQIVVDPDQFPTGPLNITGLAFRAAPGTGPANITIDGAFSLSTSTTWANSNGHPLLSTTFANNVGAGRQLVFSGTAGLSGPGCSSPGPCPFSAPIAFTTPFPYNQANGPLLIDVDATSFDGSGASTDYLFCSNACAVNMMSATVPGSPTGAVAGGSNIVQLTYTVPPQSVPAVGAWGVLALGLSLAAICWWVARPRMAR